MTILQAIILAIIEGITEFLPVSSTGHIILGAAIMGIKSNDFVKLFTVAIQLGTILSVLVLYYKRFLKSFDFYFKLLAAFIPAVVFGLLFNKKIDQLLESPLGVAIALLLGGIILLFVDKWFKKGTIDDTDEISYPTAIKIGFFQCISMVPGTSRSAASIVGGMAQKLTRKAAAEFSFFLAVPTMFGATAKKLYDFYKEGHNITHDEINLLLVGNLVGFLVAMLAIKTFIGYLSKHGFKVFGYYRIIVGSIILLLYLTGHSLEII